MISVLVYFSAIFVAARHRHQSPWLYLIMVGFLGAISSHSGSILFRILLMSNTENIVWISSSPLNGFFALCGFAGWLGGIAVAVGVVGLVTDMVRRFKMWREVQEDAVAAEEIAAGRPGEGPG